MQPVECFAGDPESFATAGVSPTFPRSSPFLSPLAPAAARYRCCGSAGVGSTASSRRKPMLQLFALLLVSVSGARAAIGVIPSGSDCGKEIRSSGSKAAMISHTHLSGTLASQCVVFLDRCLEILFPKSPSSLLGVTREVQADPLSATCDCDCNCCRKSPRYQPNGDESVVH